MPLLNEEQLRQLKTTKPQRCEECKQETWKNYCRSCDVFFWSGHSVICSRVNNDSDDDHCSHRTY